VDHVPGGCARVTGSHLGSVWRYMIHGMLLMECGALGHFSSVQVPVSGTPLFSLVCSMSVCVGLGLYCFVCGCTSQVSKCLFQVLDVVAIKVQFPLICLRDLESLDIRDR
jgi:hypothetical protein